MRTRIDHALLAVTLFATTTATIAGTTSSELKVDGMLRIKGGSLSGARAIIVSSDAEPTVIRDGLSHFDHTFQLQTKYLVSFEREGCVTKQILFDTNVPAGYLGHAPFSFPFEVTLEHPPTGTTFEYAGPVGFVRFMPELEDFGYDTDYRIKSDPSLFERMRAFHIADTAPVISTSPVPMPTERREASLPGPDLADSEGVLAPTISKVPPLVHPTAEPLTIPTAVLAEPAMLIVAVPGPINAVAAMKVLPHRALVDPLLPSLAQRDQGVVLGDDRQETLLVEPRSVTTIVRITHDGAVVELRRVAHQYGAVFYFKSGQSCTEGQYAAGIAQPWAVR